MSTCRGLDVSSFQGTQNWAAHKADGVVFAFAKASEGQHTHDPRFATHITGIKQAGLVPGAYHFAWPNQDPAAEAANYISAVKPHAGAGFVHWLDLERRSDGANYKGRTAAQIRAWAAKWIALVAAAYPGQRVGAYTSGSDLAAGHLPTGVPLWYPAYPGTSVDTYAEAEAHARLKPSGWTPIIWQFTSTPLDRSICYLTEAGLRAWAGETEAPVTPQEITAIADAVFAKLAAGGGVLENSDVDRIVKAVLSTDGIIAAPADAPDVKTNPFWALQSYIKDTNARLRAVQATEAAQGATIAKLTETVATLASNTAAIDPAKLVAEIQQAINNVTVHLTTS